MATGFISQQADRSYPGSSANGIGAWIWGQKFTSPAGGAGAFNVTELGVYCDNSGTAGGGTFQMAIYDLDGSGDLDNCVGHSGASSEQDPSSAGWVAFTGLSISIDGSTEYAICVWPDDGAFDCEGINSTGGNVEANTSPGTPWTWPDLAGDSQSGTIDAGIYAVYEAAAGGGLSIPVAMYHYMNNQ